MLHFQDLKNKGVSGCTDYTIDDRDVKNVTMAGLVHDLGHGPFCHLFDRQVIPTIMQLNNQIVNSQNLEWEHEDASGMLFEYMIDKHNFDIELDELDKDLIARLIQGHPLKKDEDKEWMFEVVANKRN